MTTPPDYSSAPRERRRRAAVEHACPRRNRGDGATTAGRIFRQLFSIDTRSLAAMRIGIGLVSLWDLFDRSHWLVKYYTDDGVLPRALLGGGSARLASVYLFSGSAHFVAILFMVHALFAMALTIGYRTWLATLGCLIMSWSLTSRVVFVARGGDAVIGWLLIWSLFLPLGAAWSVDGRIRRRKGIEGVGRRKICTAATAAVLLQVVLIYAGAVTGRIGSRPWGMDLSAVYYIMTGAVGTPLGHLVARCAILTRVMTAGTLILETVGPVTALLVGRSPTIRMSIVLSFCMLHFMIGLTMYAGVFPAISIVMWMLFVPGMVWRKLGRTWVGKLGFSAPGRGTARPKKRAQWFVRRQGSWIAGAMVSLIFAYVLVVNLASDVPPRLVGSMGFLGRLPKCKQLWKLAATAPPVRLQMTVQGMLADGKQFVFYRGPVDYPSTLMNDLWPPGDTRDRDYSTDLAYRVTDPNVLPVIRRFCEWHRHQWEGVHPGQVVTHVDMVWSCIPLPTFEFEEPDPAHPLVERDVLVYSWNKQADSR